MAVPEVNAQQVGGIPKGQSLLNMKNELDEEDLNLSLTYKDKDVLQMRNVSSIRYQKKLMAKAHSIKINDVCNSNCSKEHIQHQISEEDGEFDDDEYHPEIESLLSKQTIYLHQWHRRVNEMEQFGGA